MMHFGNGDKPNNNSHDNIYGVAICQSSPWESKWASKV